MPETGLEPARDCSRQPLKLVRLPIPPLRHVWKLLRLAATFQGGRANLRQSLKNSAVAAAVATGCVYCG